MGPVWRTIIRVMVSRLQVFLFAALLCGGLSFCLVSAQEEQRVIQTGVFFRSREVVREVVSKTWSYIFPPRLPEGDIPPDTGNKQTKVNKSKNGVLWKIFLWWRAQSEKLASDWHEATSMTSDPKELQNVREQCACLVILYVIVHHGLRIVTFNNYRDWIVMKPSCSEQVGDCHMLPSAFNCRLKTPGLHLRYIVEIAHGQTDLILAFVMGLAMYLHIMCPSFVVVFMVFIQFVGFQASSWFDIFAELKSMTPCIEKSVQCLTMYARQLVTTTVLQMATSCICVAFYAIPILFKEPPRVFQRPFAPPLAWWTPNPFWVEVNATSVTETWKTVVQEYRKPEAGLFFYFTTAEHLWTMLIVKLVIDALILAELRRTDVASLWTGHVIKLKAIFPFLLIMHRVNLFPMLQLTPMTLGINAFMAITNVSFAMMINPLVGVFLSVCKLIPFVGGCVAWILQKLFNNVAKPFQSQIYGNTMIDAFTLSGPAYTKATGETHMTVVMVFGVVLFFLSICLNLSHIESSEVLTHVSNNIKAVLCRPHRPTLKLASFVWIFMAGFVLFTRSDLLVSAIDSTVATNNLEWPVSIIVVLCVDVAINLMWFILFVAGTVCRMFSDKNNSDRLCFQTVHFMHSHAKDTTRIKSDNLVIQTHAYVQLPSFQILFMFDERVYFYMVMSICLPIEVPLASRLLGNVDLTRTMECCYYDQDEGQGILYGKYARRRIYMDKMRAKNLKREALAKESAQKDKAVANEGIINAPPKAKTASPTVLKLKPVSTETALSNNMSADTTSKVNTWLLSVKDTACTFLQTKKATILAAHTTTSRTHTTPRKKNQPLSYEHQCPYVPEDHIMALSDAKIEQLNDEKREQLKASGLKTTTPKVCKNSNSGKKGITCKHVFFGYLMFAGVCIVYMCVGYGALLFEGGPVPVATGQAPFQEPTVVPMPEIKILEDKLAAALSDYARHNESLQQKTAILEESLREQILIASDMTLKLGDAKQDVLNFQTKLESASSDLQDTLLRQKDWNRTMLASLDAGKEALRNMTHQHHVLQAALDRQQVSNSSMLASLDTSRVALRDMTQQHDALMAEVLSFRNKPNVCACTKSGMPTRLEEVHVALSTMTREHDVLQAKVLDLQSALNNSVPALEFESVQLVAEQCRGAYDRLDMSYDYLINFSIDWLSDLEQRTTTLVDLVDMQEDAMEEALAEEDAMEEAPEHDTTSDDARANEVATRAPSSVVRSVAMEVLSNIMAPTVVFLVPFSVFVAFCGY